MNAKPRVRATPEPPAPRRQDRWQNLVQGAFLLEQQLSQQPDADALQRTLTMLESFLEVFPSSVDPVDDFEGFAVRRLLLSLHRTLEEQGSRPPPPRQVRVPGMAARRRSSRVVFPQPRD